MMPLPAWSRMTSISNSFQPCDATPRRAPRRPATARGPAPRSRRSSSLIVRDAAARAAERERRGAARPDSRARSTMASRVGHRSRRSRERAVSMPSSAMHSLKSLRSSPRSMAARSQPMISTSYLSRTPGARRARRPQVEAGLPAEGGQKRVGALLLDDLARTNSGVMRLDVGAVGESRVGHDGGRVAVDQHHSVAVGLQHLAGLRARVVELARLADDDGSGPDDEDGLDVVALRHGSLLPPPPRWRPARRRSSRRGGRRRCRCRGSPRGRP